ncbi:hypothetical protein I3843_05G198200 [Carya illinoinensis]|nr:hypothetical protein I3843_05G198200 [Carya illinoinensis]
MQGVITFTQDTMVCCNVCGRQAKRGTRVIFHCNKCDFNLDPECIDVSPATPSNIKTVPDKELQSSTKYFSHEHPLILYINIPRDRVYCRVCRKYCSDNAYGCLPCAFFLDPSCAELKLPREIQHFYHSCLLTLYTEPKVVQQIAWQTSNFSPSCRACHQTFPYEAFYYGCLRCLFVMDIDCTLLPASLATGSSSQRKHHPIFHGHPLSLYEEKNEGQVNCFVCGKGCNSSSAIYSCGRSTCRDIYIDESCIELPLKIYHPLHLSHPLFLLEQKGPRGKCNACRKDTLSFAYICQHDNCSFFLDIICGGVRVPAINYEAHSHLLHFREGTDDRVLKCNACDKSCESSIFSCLYCHWNLHYTCGPLPNRITHKCHEDPLVLTTALAEHEDEMDDEFYCDVCEKQRDQLLPSYQCTDCNFVAEIGCVKSEVMSLLKGDHGDHVELKDPFGQLGKLIMVPKNTIKDKMLQNEEEQSEPTLRLSKILKSLNEDESKELRRVLEPRQIRQTVNAEEIFSDDPGEDNILRFSDKGYTQFIKFLDRGTEISVELREGGTEVRFRSLDAKSHNDYFALEEEVVNVGEHHKAAWTFAPILRILLSKHGDISSASTLSPNVKLFFLNMLCGCIYSMRNTKVVDITKDLLLVWWTSLRTCQDAGFEIKPLVDHLKRVAHAFFGLYIGKQADKIERDIAKLSQVLEELKRNHDCIASSTKPDSVKECLMEASVLKKGKAITERLWDKLI